MADQFFDADKQPGEVVNREVDFGPKLVTGETLTAGSMSATAMRVDTSADVTAALLENPPVISGTKVRYQMKDGLNTVKYKITLKVNTSAGQSLEADITIVVSEK